MGKNLVRLSIVQICPNEIMGQAPCFPAFGFGENVDTKPNVLPLHRNFIEKGKQFFLLFRPKKEYLLESLLLVWGIGCSNTDVSLCPIKKVKKELVT